MNRQQCIHVNTIPSRCSKLPWEFQNIEKNRWNARPIVLQTERYQEFTVPDIVSTFNRHQDLFEKEHTIKQYRATGYFRKDYKGTKNNIKEDDISKEISNRLLTSETTQSLIPNIAGSSFIPKGQVKASDHSHVVSTTLKKETNLLNWKPRIQLQSIKSMATNDGGKGDVICLNEDTASSTINYNLEGNTKSHDKRDAITNIKELYPLRSSLFYNVPPYLYFRNDVDKMMKLPKEISKMLRWKLSDITPSVVLRIVSRSGFKITKDETMWLSTWGRHVKSQKFAELEENQKVNHLPGSFHLGRKDRLWVNIARMQKLYGKDDFTIMPQTFILPRDTKKLQKVWSETENDSNWIIKPPASARGIGVTVIHQWEDVPITRPVIVQKYISRPYLINDSKFDLRLYVLITSMDPLRVYVYKEGLVRFASEKYTSSLNHLNEKFVHLTNYSINCSNSNYTENQDENLPQGHKWTLRCLWIYFREIGIDDKKIWASLLDVIIKTIISCENPMSKLISTYCKNRYCSYELFGFDIMLDYLLKPWILEVNISPSLQTKSKLDLKVKSELIKDMFNTVGFHIPEEINLSPKRYFQLIRRAGMRVPGDICWNKHLYHFDVSPEEKLKQIDFESGKLKESLLLKNLTADDVKQLVQTEDELARCGHFIRAFPSSTSHLYLKYFRHKKYYNYLLNAWEKKYRGRKKMGILLLQTFCIQKFHLQSTQQSENEQNDVVSAKQINAQLL